MSKNTFEYLINFYNLNNHIKNIKDSKIYYKKIKNFNILKNIVLDILKKYKTYYWNNKEIKNYKGISLTYNENFPNNIYNQTLGENNEDFNLNYEDSMSFNIVNEPGLLILNFLNENIKELENLQIIRSRIAILEGNIKNTNTWHCDESPYHCLRINIPIVTNENYFFQFEKSLPVNLKESYMYWFNGKKLHRFFNKKTENFERIHLILGFSPWFKYDKTSKSWFLNEKNLKKNPLKLIKNEGSINPSSYFSPNN